MTLRRLSRYHPSDAGFTLVELLTVIAIIAVLAAIIIPTVGTVQDRARKATASSNLRQIAIAYQTYTTSGGRPRAVVATDVYDYARILAQYADLNDPKIWILGEDPRAELVDADLPLVVATPPGGGAGADWTVSEGFRQFPVSFAVANRLSTRAPGSTTPLAWTRGLGSDGTWAAETTAPYGVYGTEGGHIAYADGHVEWFENTRGDGSGLLLDYENKTPTVNVEEAISPGAEVLESDQ